MIKILYINPSGTGVFDRHFQGLLNAAASSGTQVDTTHLSLKDKVTSPFLSSPVLSRGTFQDYQTGRRGWL
jgi:hypothetical protein